MPRGKTGPDQASLALSSNVRYRALSPARPQGRTAAPAAGPAKSSFRFSPLRAERVADQVYRQLRRAILTGELVAGSRLREVEIANAMEVSRTPVREAVSRLIGDRLVRELPVGGVEVVDTSAELYEVYVIREALECCAGRLAAARIDENKIKKLEELLARMEAINYVDVEEREAVNSEFHMTLVEAAASPRLLNMILGFREFFMSRGRSRHDRKRANQAVQDHRDLITALRARDADQVEKVLRRHLKLAYVDLIVREAEKNRSA